MGLDNFELMMTIEEEFDVCIQNHVTSKLTHLGDIHRFVIQFLQERGEAVDPDEVWERLKVIVHREFAIPEEQIVPEAHLVYDLGLG